MYFKFLLQFHRKIHKEHFCIPVLKTLLVVTVSLDLDKQQGVLLPGRNWNCSDVIYKNSHFKILFAYPLLTTSPLLCFGGDGVSATEQYVFLKSMVRQFPLYLARSTGRLCRKCDEQWGQRWLKAQIYWIVTPQMFIWAVHPLLSG